MEGQTAVMRFINETFSLPHIQIKDFPKLPSGKLIKDVNGTETLVFYDWLNRRVMYGEPVKKKKCAYIPM